jgi:hypothetical protein
MDRHRSVRLDVCERVDAVTDLERDVVEEFKERIAIMTIDGQQPEVMAIKHAYRIVRERYGRQALPQCVVDAWGKVMKG